jgi:hypothetical protein
MSERVEDPGQGAVTRISRVLVWTQMALALLALATILLVREVGKPGMGTASGEGTARSLVVLATGVPLLWLIAPEPRTRRRPATLLLLVPGVMDLVNSLPSLSATAGKSASALATNPSNGPSDIDLATSVLMPSWTHELTHMLSEWSGPLTRAAIAVALINALLVNLPGPLPAGRWLRIPLWTCTALGVAALALAGLAAHIMRDDRLGVSEDTLRCAAPTLVAAVLALILIGRSSRRARWGVFAILLVPALWYVWTQIGDLVSPPEPSPPSHPWPNRLNHPDLRAMDAAWGLGTLAWQTIRLAIGMLLVSAVLNVLIRPAHLASRPDGG